MLNALLVAALWSVILAPFYVEWRAGRGVREDVRSLVRFSEARKALRR